mmetsp:Transcript_54997/g.178098  ORF Transcript_54997/g.178098 Transcript_54997/m.178098 type:complete len:271 (+) Transcript_54997:324-1136(+)
MLQVVHRHRGVRLPGPNGIKGVPIGEAVEGARGDDLRAHEFRERLLFRLPRRHGHCAAVAAAARAGAAAAARRGHRRACSSSFSPISKGFSKRRFLCELRLPQRLLATGVLGGLVAEVSVRERLHCRREALLSPGHGHEVAGAHAEILVELPEGARRAPGGGGLRRGRLRRGHGRRRRGRRVLVHGLVVEEVHGLELVQCGREVSPVGQAVGSGTVAHRAGHTGVIHRREAVGGGQEAPAATHRGEVVRRQCFRLGLRSRSTWTAHRHGP